MKLFKLVSFGKPIFVVANDLDAAQKKWRESAAKENNLEPDEVTDPTSVELIAGGKGLLH